MRDENIVCAGCGERDAEEGGLCGDCAFEAMIAERPTVELDALAERVLAERDRRLRKLNCANG